MADDDTNRNKNPARETNIGLGIDWTFRNLDGLINNRGEEVIHEIGMRCTCSNEDTYAGQTTDGPHVMRRRQTINCHECGGEGYMFRDARKVVGLVTGITEDFQRMEAEWGTPGDCTFSPKLGYQISAGDKITFTWAQPLAEGQVIVRGAGTLGDNTERKGIDLSTNEDRLWYHAETAIWCEDEDGTIYRQNGDFVLDGTRVIKWISGPALRKKYVIKYNAFLEWIAWVPPNVRRDRQRDLGARVPLRKSHVALVNHDDLRVKPSDRVPFCTRVQC